MFINSFVTRHKMFLSLGPKKLLVRSQIELLHCRWLLCDDIDHELSTIKSSELGRVLLAAPVHGGAVNKGREGVELLPVAPLAHGGRADKVEAGHGFIDLEEKWVSWGNFDVETFWVALGLNFTTVK